jgi:hypothetical protein
MKGTTSTSIGSVIFLFLWIMGFVVAKGFWSTLFCIIPFWALYLSIEHILLSVGWL